MLSAIWNFLLYKPLVNALAFLVFIIPGADLGIAIIVLTVLVKILLYPLSQRSIESQAKMNAIAPELEAIKKNAKTKEEEGRLTLEFYQKHKVNPLSGCLLVLIQFPIIIALYLVFLKGVKFDSSTLYSFIHIPQDVSMMFLGLINIGEKSLVLALLAAASQFLQAYYMPQAPVSKNNPGSLQESFAKSMQMQMKYVFPILIFFILYTDLLGSSASGAIALYWITSNLFSVAQQIYANRKKSNVLVVSPQ